MPAPSSQPKLEGDSREVVAYQLLQEYLESLDVEERKEIRKDIKKLANRYREFILASAL